MSKNKLISEDLKRYKQLLEYTFYVPEKDDSKDVNGDLLLDDMYLTEQGTEEEDPFFATDEEGGAEAPAEVPAETPAEVPAEEGTPTDEVPADTSTDPFGSGMAVEDEAADEDTIEVDVTDIVDKTEQTKTSVDGVSTKMDELLTKLSDLENQVSGMDKVITQIDRLEKEIEKRNPTPVERLEMRSMDSFPYSIKLTDFWKDREGYDVSEEDEEYTLRQSDIDNFNEKDIKSSFNSPHSEDEKN